MKRYNYLFENENGPFFVYCETGFVDALKIACEITEGLDCGDLVCIGKFTDDEADDMGYDTY